MPLSQNVIDDDGYDGYDMVTNNMILIFTPCSPLKRLEQAWLNHHLR